MSIIRSDDPAAAPYDPPAPVPCEYCGRPRFTRGIVRSGSIFWIPTGPEKCDCEGARKEQEAREKAKAEAERREAERKEAERQRARIESIIGASGLGRRFLNRRFESFQVTAENAEGYETAKGYAEGFSLLKDDQAMQEENGLLIYGPKGTGKTHMAAAIANDLLRQGVPVVFATMIDLLAKIKDSFDRNQGASEEEILRLYKTCDLLIIDDLGKEQPTEWALAKIYQIINARYEDYRPIVVTSNYSPQELVDRMTPKGGDRITADATVDRIIEMTTSVGLGGTSWRSKK